LTAEELQLLYTASDFTIISRNPGGKESGVLLEAVSRGLPIVVSDHDPSLARVLDHQPWARLFRHGDPDCLATALDDLVQHPLARPPENVSARLGMVQAEQMLAAFDQRVTAMLRRNSSTEDGSDTRS